MSSRRALLAWLSFEYFRNWPVRVGGDCGFVRTGFVQIAAREKEARLRSNVAAQQQMGIPTMVVSADDVRRLAPGFFADDFDFAAYEPESGYADPQATTKSFMDAARCQGAQLVPECRVTGVLTEGGRVVGVDSTRGRFHAPIIVNAAGPWAPEIAGMVGLQLPVKVLRHDVMIVRRPPEMGPTHPTVIDDINAMHFRPEGEALTLVGLDDVNTLDESPDGSTEYARPGFVERAVARVCQRVPRMENGSLHSAYCGYEGIAVDSKPLLDQAGPAGFYLACGFSGTGFKTAPAIGRCLAQLILDGQVKDVDFSPYLWRRFSGGELERMLASEQAFTVQ